MFKFVCSFLSLFFVVSGGGWSTQQDEALWKTPEDVYQFVKFSEKAYECWDTLRVDPTLHLFYENGRENDTSYCGFVTHVTIRKTNTRPAIEVVVVSFHGTRPSHFLRDVRIDLRVRGEDGGYAREIAPNDQNFWDTPIAPDKEAFWVHPGFAEQVMSCYSGPRGFARAIEEVLRATPLSGDHLYGTQYGGSNGAACSFALLQKKLASFPRTKQDQSLCLFFSCYFQFKCTRYL